MSDYTDYADRLAERRSTDISSEEGYVPQFARRGPWYAIRDLPRVIQDLQSARNRARESQIAEVLAKRPSLDLLLNAPLGPQVPLQALVEQEPRLVLLSQAGAGKSTALDYLTTHRLPGKDDDLLTIVVALPELAASEQSLPEFLAADAEGHLAMTLSPDFFDDVLWTGQALVCLDGLDKVATEGARARVIEQIEKLEETYPRSRYLVTVRANAYSPTLDPDTWAHYTLVPWSDTVTVDLERDWAEASPEMTEEEVETKLASAPPLLQDIVGARATVSLLDDGGVDAVWDEIRSHLWDASWQERIALVYRFLSQDHPDVWATLLERLFSAELNDPFKMVTHRYLLAALHALTASEVSDALDAAVIKRVVDAGVDWMMTAEAPGRQAAVDALFQLANVPYAGERILEVAQDDEADDLSRQAAALLLGVLSGPDPELVVEALWVLVDDIEGADRVRQSAATALGYLASVAPPDAELQPTVVEGLISRAQDTQLPIDLLVALVEALGVVALAQEPLDGDLSDALIKLARGETEEKVSFSVQMAAGRCLNALLMQGQDDAYVQQMWELARDEDVDESVRTVLAETLGGLDADSAQEAAHVLLAIAQHEKVYPPGHRAALEAIGRLGYSDEALVEALIEIAENTDRKKAKDFERLAASQALGEIGHLDLSLQHLLMLIADKSIYRSTRNEALALLGEGGLSGDEDLDSAVIAVLQVWVTEWNTTEDVRERAMKSLEMIRLAPEDVVRDLIGVAQDSRSYPRVRRAAVGALSRLPVEDKELIVKSLEVPFYDRDEKSDLLRVPMARLLYLWGKNEQGLEYLQLAADQSYQAMVRYRAGQVLYELGDTENAFAALHKLATDSSIADPIRCGSLRMLAFRNPGDEKLAEDLKPILGEEELLPSVREAVFSAARSLLLA